MFAISMDAYCGKLRNELSKVAMFVTDDFHLVPSISCIFKSYLETTVCLNPGKMLFLAI